MTTGFQFAFGAFMAFQVALAGQVAHADDAVESDHAYLDPPYRNLRHPLPSIDASSLRGARSMLPERSNTTATIQSSTPVKSQGSRGTCSIFSATALLETLLVLDGQFQPDLDLSEEWLEYVIQRESPSEGSTSYSNFRAFKEYASTFEALMPYIGQTWSDVGSPTAKAFCGKSRDQERCLRAHRDPSLLELTDDQLARRDPDFLKARRAAQELKEKSLRSLTAGDSTVDSMDQAKALLARGIPVTVDVDFFYGAWNHRHGVELGIGRDVRNWEAGIVGFPEPGSVDLAKSPTVPAGHSVLLVGYDDTITVSTSVLMEDGSTKTFTYTGVFFFKNSWGTDGFGKNAKIEGRSQPGYGTMVQQYAERYGQFFRLPYTLRR